MCGADGRVSAYLLSDAFDSGPGYKKRSKSPRVSDKKKAAAKIKKMAPIRIKLSPISAKRKKSCSVSARHLSLPFQVLPLLPVDPPFFPSSR